MEPKLIDGFPNYRIHRDGTIESRYMPKTSKTSAVWRPIQHVIDSSSTGYFLVTLCHEKKRQNKRVHRLLMEAFVPNPEGKAHVNHIDGNKENNALENLEWATPQENAIHATALGLNTAATEASMVKVDQYSKCKSIFIATHDSLHEAGRAVPSAAWQNIWKVCNEKRHTAGGFHWKYSKV